MNTIFALPFTNPLEAYESMYLIRHTEETIANKYSEQKMRCPTHLSIGQEGCAVGVMKALNFGDRVFSTHRCHAHYLAKGGSVNGLVAELYGKSEGCAAGIGGSMHLVDESSNFLGTSAIVGSSISVALGSAMALKQNKSNNIAVAFFGDAARETGQLYECFNMAALWNLPIMFVCEDNGYSTQTPLKQRQPKRDFGEVVRSMGLAAFEASDDTFGSVNESARYARNICPSYLEIPTYRYREHVGPNYDYDMGYRSEEEVRIAEKKDPVKKLRNELLLKDVPESVLVAVERKIHKEVEQAFLMADDSQWPTATWLSI